MRDLRFAWRSLTRKPGFTIAAVLSLALAIGANTAIFTIADQVLLRMLPVKDPQRLVQLNWKGEFVGGSLRGGTEAFSYPAYTEMRDTAPAVFTGIAARYQTDADLSEKASTERVSAELVSGNYFETLGVTAAVGRVLTAEDDRVKDGSPLIVLSYDYWQRRFGGNAGILNRPVNVNGRAMTIVGVSQRGFRGFDSLNPSDLFVPLVMKHAMTPAWDHLDRRNSAWLRVFARLSPAVGVEAAKSAMQVVYRQTIENDLEALSRSQDFRSRYRKNVIELASAAKGFPQTREFFARPIQVLMAMVGAFLLMACVNVANLLITRSAARQKEIAIRLSLGATRGAVARLILAESVLLAGAAGVLGLVLSAWISSLLVGLLPYTQMASAMETAPGGRVLAFTGLLTLFTAILSGLMPALQASRPAIAAVLKTDSSTMSAGIGQLRLRRFLVTAQVTLSVMLLVCAGWFSRSLYKLLTVDSGLGASRLVTFTIDPSLHNYTPARARALFLDLQRALGPNASAAVFPVLADVRWENTLWIEGRPINESEDMQAGWNQMMPRFFSVAGVPLVAGREFTERDAGGSQPVVIVNETFVRRFYPKQNPLGHHIGFGGKGNLEIIGVVKDFKSGSLKDDSKPWTYTAALQDPNPSAMTFYVASSGDAAAVPPAARRSLARLDSSLPMYEVKTIQAQINETHFVDRAFAILSMAFGAVATLLASIGLFGVTAYAVARRTQEIGIRLALGARRGDIVGLVMREVVWITTAGVVAGVPLAIAVGRLVESQMYGVRSGDPVVLVAATLLIAAASILAGYLPCRRATRIDPLVALRYE